MNEQMDRFINDLQQNNEEQGEEAAHMEADDTLTKVISYLASQLTLLTGDPWEQDARNIIFEYEKVPKWYA